MDGAQWRLRATAPHLWIALVTIFLLLNAGLFRLFSFGADWAPLWVAGKIAWTDVAKVYDFNLVTSLQAPLLGHVDHRPFIYAPTALLLIMPLALLPFWLSLAIFSLGSALYLLFASRGFGADRILLLIAPPVVLCAMAGQPTLLVAALAAVAVARLGSRDMSAGVLLGIAIAIKPTLCVLAPVALLAGRHLRALSVAGVTAAIIAALSVALLGVEPWAEWINALPRFQQLVLDEPSLVTSAIASYATAIRFGLNPYLALSLGALVALPMTAYAFARSEDAAVRLVVLLGGALLVTPYAMNYELALFAPVVLSLPISTPRRLILPTIWSASLCSGASLAGLIAVYAWAAAKALGLPGSRRDDRSVESGIHVRA